MGKPLQPLTDSQRKRLRQSLALHGRTAVVAMDHIKYSVTCTHTRKMDTRVNVQLVDLRETAPWWMDHSSRREFVRRVRLDGIGNSWPEKEEPNDANPKWWTSSVEAGGNVVLSATVCRKLEDLFLLVLSEVVGDIILE